MKSSDYISNQILKNFGNEVEIKNFSILWSVFECEKCDNNAGVGKFRILVEKIKNVDEDSKDFLEFLRRRYINSEDKFYSLDFEKSRILGEELDKIKDIILNNSDNYDEKEIIFSLLVVLYRIRNNFFHGEKARYSFQGQSDLFEACNAFLISLITRK